MGDLMSQGQRLLAPLQSLVGITQMPQGPRRKREAGYPSVKGPIEESQRTVLLRVIEGNALLKVLSSTNQLARVEQAYP